eukprot:m.55649 g.55649  ORF g.55649 m.55649 type:complete len:87 (+) comp12962_c0_seq1:36-296(+)
MIFSTKKSEIERIYRQPCLDLRVSCRSSSLRPCDQLLGWSAQLLRLGQGRADAIVLNESSSEVTQQRPPVLAISAELSECKAMSHL